MSKCYKIASEYNREPGWRFSLRYRQHANIERVAAHLARELPCIGGVQAQ